MFNSTAPGTPESEGVVRMEQVADTVVAAMCAVSVFIGIVQCAGVIQLQSVRTLVIIKRRYPDIVMIEGIVVILVSLIVVPLTMINNQWLEIHQNTESAYLPYSIWTRTSLWTTIVPAGSFFLSHIEALRLWVMFFQLRLLETLQNEDWELNITSNLWTKDFFLRNMHKWGNIKWLQKWVFVYWLVITVASALNLSYIHHDDEYTSYDQTISYPTTAVLQRLPLTLIAFIYWKAPTDQQDYMMINHEFRGTCLLIAMSFAGYIASVILSVCGNEVSAFCAAALSWMFTVSAPSLISTIYIPMRIKVEQRMSAAMLAECLTLDSGVFDDRRINDDGSTTGTLRGELAILWGNEQKMRALILAMTREFSMKIMMCFIELVQFKEHVIALISRQNPLFVASDVVEQRYKFYQHIPQSSIVFGGDVDFNLDVEIDQALQREDAVEMAMIDEQKEQMRFPEAVPVVMGNGTTVDEEVPQVLEIVLEANDMRRFQHSTLLLFRKYFKTGSPLEVDIGCRLKDKLKEVENAGYSSLKPMEWVNLYDEVLRELELPITAAYSRMIRRLHRDQELARSSPMKMSIPSARSSVESVQRKSPTKRGHQSVTQNSVDAP